MTRTYTADDYRRMLATVIDANYGADSHDIGNGDGIPEAEASELREFWEEYLNDAIRKHNEQQVGKGRGRLG